MDICLIPGSQPVVVAGFCSCFWGFWVAWGFYLQLTVKTYKYSLLQGGDLSKTHCIYIILMNIYFLDLVDKIGKMLHSTLQSLEKSCSST